MKQLRCEVGCFASSEVKFALKTLAQANFTAAGNFTCPQGKLNSNLKFLQNFKFQSVEKVLYGGEAAQGSLV